MAMFKKISAMVMATAMAATMVGTGLSASATSFTSADGTTKSGVFYAYWDADDDGDDEWAPAPYNMDDGNIAAITENADDTYTLTLQDATFSIPMIGEKTGWIENLVNPNSVDVVSVDTNSYGHPKTATVEATDISGWTAEDFANADNADCIKYDMTAKVYLVGSIAIQHEQKGVIFVVE